MSRVNNANEFLRRFRALSAEYDDRFGPRLAALRKKYDAKPGKRDPQVDEALEDHMREYVINGFLSALNWRMGAAPEDGLPNLVPETPVRSLASERSIRMDYFGLESTTDDPLMIVETKRPLYALPRLKAGDSTHAPEIIAKGLGGEELTGAWNQWLDDLGVYVKSVEKRAGKTPVRAILTNGDWYVFFLNPADAFLDSGTRDVEDIMVFASRSQVEARANDVFLQLEHSRVLGETPAIPVAQVGFVLDKARIDRAVHGLFLRYAATPGILDAAVPAIVVVPVIFLRSRSGSWFRVVGQSKDYHLPARVPELTRHLRDVDKAARELLETINTHLGSELKPVGLVSHYLSDVATRALVGVCEEEEDRFCLVTGDTTHYLKEIPSVAGCEWHDYGAANAAGHATQAGIHSPSTEPRSFFASKDDHHCAHAAVRSAKLAVVEQANRAACGPRSAHDGQAFCEIWHFESQLCCRACVYEPVCTKASAFSLPCDAEAANAE